MAEILANSILPANREEVTLFTEDGLSLVGELATPTDRPPISTIVCLHPLPTHGGSMDSHLFRKAAWRLPALAGVAVLRFNTRGTRSELGRSDGAFGDGDAERLDLLAALEYVDTHDLPVPWLVGWSFGADVALKHGCLPSAVGAILLSPPLTRVTDADLRPWARSGRPVIALIPERDDHLAPDAARARFAAVPHAKVVEVAKAGHLWVGHADTALDLITRRVAPRRFPLAREWDGAMAPGPTEAAVPVERSAYSMEYRE
jgi:alpha/beta superfamily hydrolase